MKQWKGWKLAAFTLMFVFVLAGTIGLITLAADTEKGFAENQIEVDYINETITVTVADRDEDNGNKFPTEDLKNLDTVVYYTDKYNKDVSKWEACEVRIKEFEIEKDGKIEKEERAVAVFDISWVNDSKTVRLYLCGNQVNTKVVAVDLIWEEDFKVGFTGTLLATDITEAEQWQAVYKSYPNFSEDTGYFIFTLEDDGRDNYYFNLENILWRKGSDGVWRKFEELDLKELNIRGLKLEFRIAASNGEEPARASSTAKYTVTELSSAPLITVNPDTMTTTLKNGLEFSFTWGPDKGDWIMLPEYSKKFGEDLNPDGMDFVSMEERANEYTKIYTNERTTELMIQQVLAAYLEANGIKYDLNSKLDAKTLADYKNSGKELFTFTEDGKGILLYVREIGTENNAASKIAEVVIPCANENLAQPDEKALEISYGESKTNNGGIMITNKSEYKYQVAVLDPSHPDYDKVATDAENIDISDLKWTSIRAGKTMKLANKKVPKDSYLLYRIAGEEGSLPSTYLVTDKMEYNGLTYAGIASDSKLTGAVLEAVVSTNLEIGKDNITFKWQVCEDVKAENPVWTDISGATSATFELAAEQVGKYVRVMITGPDGKSMASDHVGPIREGKAEEKEEEES